MRAPETQPAPTGVKATQEELVQHVYHLIAQRGADQVTWKALVANHNEMAARIETLEREDMQYNDRINLDAGHCNLVTKRVESNCDLQIKGFVTDTLAGMSALENKINGSIKVFRDNDTKVMEDTKVLIKQMEDHVTQIQLSLAQKDATLGHHLANIELMEKGLEQLKAQRVPLINPQSQAQTFNIATPLKGRNDGDGGNPLPQGMAMPMGPPGMDATTGGAAAVASGAAGVQGADP